jgi:hypothetical protein
VSLGGTGDPTYLLKGDLALRRDKVKLVNHVRSPEKRRSHRDQGRIKAKLVPFCGQSGARQNAPDNTPAPHPPQHRRKP